MIAGVSLILASAVLQGIFLLPMSRVRGWAWERVWLVFSLTGMLFGNWILTLVVLPNPLAIFAGVPWREAVTLAGFGLAWGAGAVMFGLAMDRLGLALGYPLIMGLNASVGTFVPLLWFDGRGIFSGRSLLICVGTLIAIAGIAVCSVAGALRQSSSGSANAISPARFVSGLVMAAVSGCLSCLPNIGLAYGTTTMAAARRLGASPAFTGDAVWSVFFTFGSLVNVAYCFRLMYRNKNLGTLVDVKYVGNGCWSVAMGLMWIASFYLYGLGAALLGRSGSTIGWPILVSVSIAVGVLCGLGKGEWQGAPARARTLLWGGLALIVLAVLIIPLGKGAS